MSASLFDRPALLFLPASNPRAIDKARASAADIVVLDLEDAVKPGDKQRARAAAVEAVAEDWPMPVAIRINGVGSSWHDEDLTAVAGCGCLAVLPQVESAGDIAAVAERLGRRPLAMIERARGVIDAPAIAAVAAALIVGTNDLSSDLRLPPGPRRPSLQFALQSSLLAARAAGIAAFDGVFNSLDDEAGFAAECAEARALGFDGKSLIHPSQLAPCHRLFAPRPEELARAERLVAAASGGAERFEGEMVEAMHVDAARRLIARARR